MGSPEMSVPERSRWEALSNSTRSSGVAHASAVSARTAQQSISTTAAWKVTVPGNDVSLECSSEVVVRVSAPLWYFLMRFQSERDAVHPRPSHGGGHNGNSRNRPDHDC